MRTWKIVSITAVVLGMAIASQAAIINDFESYADTAALTADLILGAQTANANPTLGIGDGVGGSKSLNFTGHNGQSPWYTIVRLDVPDFSLWDTTSIDMQIKSVAGGSGELFKVKLMDEWGGTLFTGASLHTQTGISSTAFQTYSIDTTGSFSVLGAIEFVFNASDYGQATVIVDNIEAIPEPATLGLFGLAAGAMMFIRRRFRR